MAEFKSTGDAETDEVLKQMAEEGQELPEFGKPDLVEQPEETKTEEEPEAKAKAETEEEESEEEEEETPKSPRSVPIQKYEYLKDKVKDLKKQLEDAAKNPKKDVDDEIKKFAEEQNLDIDAAYKLVDLISKRAIPDDLRQQLEKAKAKQEESEMWDSQYEQYNEEFRKSLVPVIKRDNPAITDKELSALAKEMRETAFNPKNVEKSLVELYFAKDTGKKHVAGESNKIKSIPKTVSLDEITAEDMSNMSEKEFEEFSNGLAARSPKLTR